MAPDLYQEEPLPSLPCWPHLSWGACLVGSPLLLSADAARTMALDPPDAPTTQVVGYATI